ELVTPLFAHPLGGGTQGADGEFGGQVTLVLGRAPDVAHRVGRFGGAAAGLGEDLFGGRPADQRGRKFVQRGGIGVDRGQAQPGGGDRLAVERDAGTGGGDRPVTDPSFHLRVRARSVEPHRNPNLDQNLVVGERRFIGPGQEIIDRYLPFA